MAAVPLTLGMLTQNSMRKGNKKPSRLYFPNKMGKKIKLIIFCPAENCSWLHHAFIREERARLDGIAVPVHSPAQSQELLLVLRVPFCNGHIVPCLSWGHLSKQSLGIPGLRDTSGSPGESEL